jgi:hypothetical protein
MPIAEATMLRLECQLDALPVVLGKAAAEDALARRPPSGRWSALEPTPWPATTGDAHRISRMLTAPQRFPRTGGG